MIRNDIFFLPETSACAVYMNYEKFKRSDRPDRFRSLILLSTIFSPLLGKSFSMMKTVCYEHSDWSKYIFVANEYTANVLYCSLQLCIFIEPINTRVFFVSGLTQKGFRFL
jgi:hypothetical protein